MYKDRIMANNEAENLDQVRCFRISKAYAVLFSGCGILAFALAGGMLFGYSKAKEIPLFFFSLAFLFAASGAWLFVMLARSSLTVEGGFISVQGAFTKRVIDLSRYTHFRILSHTTPRAIIIFAKDKKKYTLSCHFEKSDLLIAFLGSRLINADEAENLAETKEIIGNENLGLTETERLDALRRCSRIMRVLNGAVWLLSVAVLFWPRFYDPMLISLIIIVPAVLLIIPLSQGLVKYDGRRNGVYPFVCTSVIIPSLVIFLRALLDFDIFSWKNFWMPFGILSALFLVLFFWTTKKEQINKASMIVGCVVILLYGYGSTIILNQTGNITIVDAYEVEVLDKDKSSDRRTAYYLYLSSWADRPDQNRVEVGRAAYEAYAPGDIAGVYICDGHFKIQYYIVD
jgi:hypothetical protein